MVKKLHWKLTFLYLALFAVSLVLTRQLLFPVFLGYFERDEEKHLHMESQVVKGALLAAVPDGDPERLNQLVRKIGRGSEVRITVIGHSGRVLADSQSDPSKMANHLSRPEVKQALTGKTGISIRYSTTLGKGLIYLATPLQFTQGESTVLRLAIQQQDIARTVDQVQKFMFLANAMALLVSTGLAFYLARRFTAPIRDMTRVAEEYAQGCFHNRVKVTTRDELGSLSITINEMANKIQIMISDLSREKNKIRAILTGMGDGVVALDRDGRIMLMNQAAEKMFGRLEEEVIGQHCLSLVRNHMVDELVDQVMHTSTLIAGEIRLGSGSDHLLRVHGAPIQEAPEQIAGVVLVFRDITEIRQLEQMRTEFVANVSHEMKTPLTSIKGFAETLLDGALEEQQLCRRFLGIISEETDRLHRLIDDLLSLAKIEAPRFEAAPQPTDLRQMVYKVADILAPMLKAKNITLSLDIPENLPRVIIQEDLLGQVILNLMDNGVKYTPKGGSLKVGAHNREKVYVEVTDTGLGIPEQALPRIFERFYRVDKARSQASGGTGLGLAIVKHILERYGQKVWVESTLGQGSTFTFTLETEGENK
ncbi:MAG TPA: ATP-binding protein [Bacillota bacterium]|nr:ATP-binding protein [Bacillota bacterium]